MSRTLRLTTGDWGVPGGEFGARGVLAGRYESVGFLGRGGMGWVDRARDVLSGEEVAVKWIPVGSTEDIARARREVTTLRWLRLPGVVRLRDDGVEPEGWFIVMDLVEGLPFPGVAEERTMSWDEVREPTLSLLEVLAGVHHAGIVHADLKPGNVLVRPNGQVVVLDFGIATGRALPPARSGGGTPWYMAPERRTTRNWDARVDLYAVGVMLREALCGPFAVDLSAGVDAPDDVAAVITRLVAEDPHDRPASAEAVLELFGRRLYDFGSALPGGAPASPPELAALFDGPEPFLHLPSEAARLLHGRTGGDREAVSRELTTWVRTGLAHIQGGKVRVERLALEALDAHPEEDALRALLRERASSSEILAEARRVADWWTVEGRPLRAIAAIELALPHAREDRLTDDEVELLVRWSVAALSQETREQINRARCEIGRCARLPEALKAADALLHAADAALAGLGELAAERLVDVAPFPEEELEIWRMAVLTRVARAQGREDIVLTELEAWATTPLRRAKWMGWLGNLRYRQGRYAEAAVLHLASIPGRTTRDARMSARRNAAEALLEVPDFLRAQAIAREVVAEARECGHAKLEAYATWVVRASAYRMGLPDAAGGDLLDAAGQVDRYVEGLLCVSEAATAWRAGDQERAVWAARRGVATFTAINRRDPALLCRGIELASRRAGPGEAETLAAAASACRVPEFAIQVLALARMASARPNPAWTRAAAQLAARVPTARRGVRLDVTSVDEALDPTWRPLIEVPQPTGESR